MLLNGLRRKSSQKSIGPQKPQRAVISSHTVRTCNMKHDCVARNPQPMFDRPAGDFSPAQPFLISSEPEAGFEMTAWRGWRRISGYSARPAPEGLNELFQKVIGARLAFAVRWAPVIQKINATKKFLAFLLLIQIKYFSFTFQCRIGFCRIH